MVMSQVIDVKQAKDKLEDLVRDSMLDQAPWIVADAGVPLAAIVSMEVYEDMLETVAELADEEYLVSIREARAQYLAGEVDSLQDLYDIAHDQA